LAASSQAAPRSCRSTRLPLGSRSPVPTKNEPRGLAAHSPVTPPDRRLGPLARFEGAPPTRRGGRLPLAGAGDWLPCSCVHISDGIYSICPIIRQEIQNRVTCGRVSAPLAGAADPDHLFPRHLARPLSACNPIFIVGWHPERLRVELAVGAIVGASAQAAPPDAPERRYALREVKARYTKHPSAMPS